MKKITDIYDEYKIMPNLREHMFRVAAVASTVCDNFDEVLLKKEIVSACLLHDMGNIIKFNLKNTKKLHPEFMEERDLIYWQNIQKEFISKYGKDDHEATNQIIKNVSSSENILSYIKNNRFNFLCKNRDCGDMNMKIIHYSDMRVRPNGVVSCEERMADIYERYSFKIKEYDKLFVCGKDIEQQIFSKCKIKPEDITDEAIAPIILELKNFVIE